MGSGKEGIPIPFIQGAIRGDLEEQQGTSIPHDPHHGPHCQKKPREGNLDF